VGAGRDQLEPSRLKAGGHRLEIVDSELNFYFPIHRHAGSVYGILTPSGCLAPVKDQFSTATQKPALPRDLGKKRQNIYLSILKSMVYIGSPW
jgi:hypothetical protein